VITNGNITAKHGFAQGFDEYRHEKDFPRNEYADAWKVREPILQTVDSLGDGPFLLYLHYVDPHDPYKPHADTDFSPDYHGPMDGSREALDPYSWEPPPDPADRRRAVDLYDGEILWYDHQLQVLFDRLRQRDVLDDAWVVITADHGEGLWDHRIQAHGQEVYEEQIHVPLIVLPPGGLQARVDVSLPFSHLDLGPTLLDLLGAPVPPDFEGRSWAPFLRGQGEAPVRPILVDEAVDNVRLAAIIDGTDKLVIDWDVATGQPDDVRLFDLAADPHEHPDQALDARRERSALAGRLQQQLLEALDEARGRAPEGAQAGASLSPEEQAGLRALGYLGDDMPDQQAAPPPADDTSPPPSDSPGSGKPQR
jgi:arylsulfatase A-like enzyme